MSGACPRLGFTMRLHVARATPDDLRRVMRELDELLESRGLSRIPAAPSDATSIEVFREGSQADDSDRVALRAWADAHSRVASVEVGLLAELDLTA